MLYPDQLKTPEWQSKRKEIIQRDFCCCQICFNQKIVANATRHGEMTFRSNGEGYYLIYYPDQKGDYSNRLNLKQEFSILNPRVRDFLYRDLELYTKENEGVIVPMAVRLKNTTVSNMVLKLQGAYKEKGLDFFQMDFSSNPELLKYVNEYKEGYKKDWFIVPGLNVHHTYYTKGKFAWEYDSSSLLTVCSDCHAEIHNKSEVILYSESGIEMSRLTPCFRCNGHGFIPIYYHVQNGICFRCWGVGYDELMSE